MREAELFDDTMKMEKEWRKRRGIAEEDESEDLFL